MFGVCVEDEEKGDRNEAFVMKKITSIIDKFVIHYAGFIFNSLKLFSIHSKFVT